MSVLYVQVDQYLTARNSYTSFEIDSDTIKISVTKYHHYVLSGLLFILTQQSMGQNKCGKSGHLSTFNTGSI